MRWSYFLFYDYFIWFGYIITFKFSFEFMAAFFFYCVFDRVLTFLLFRLVIKAPEEAVAPVVAEVSEIVAAHNMQYHLIKHTFWEKQYMSSGWSKVTLNCLPPLVLCYIITPESH